MKFFTDAETGINFAEPDCCDEWLGMIWAIGVDYDGMDGSIDSMKELVDELMEMAQKARDCLHQGLLFPKEDNDEEKDTGVRPV